MPATSIGKIISYHAVRSAWCRRRLASFLRKWGIYIVTGALVLGSSGSDPVATVTGLVSTAVLPLVWGMQQPIWIEAMVAIGYAGLGALLCWGMRPLLWAPAWRDIELSLPIAPRDKLRSDLIVLALALSPFYLLCLAGLSKWALSVPSQLRIQLLIAPAILLAALMLALMFGVVMLKAMRRSRRSPVRAETAKEFSKPSAWSRRHPRLHALFLMPLTRGPARRAARLLQLAPALLIAHFLLIRFPGPASWWLALFALALLLLTTRLMALLEEDLEPVHATCLALPVDMQRLQLGRRLLALMPATVATALVLPILFVFIAALRPPVAIAFVALTWAGNLLEVLLGSRPPSAKSIEASTRITLWLVTLAVQIALASEITA